MDDVEGEADQHTALMTFLFFHVCSRRFPALQAGILAEGAIALSVTFMPVDHC